MNNPTPGGPAGAYTALFKAPRGVTQTPPSPSPAPPSTSVRPAPTGAAPPSMPLGRREPPRALALLNAIAQAIAARTPDPVERASIAQHFARNHPDMGINHRLLTPDQMTDAQLAVLSHLVGRGPVQAPAGVPPGPPSGGAPAGTPAHLSDADLKTALGL